MRLIDRVNRLWFNTAAPFLAPGWLNIAPGHDDHIVLVSWMANLPDNTDPLRKVGLQVGRQWIITSDLSDRQILNTFLIAMLAFVEHELREDFRYQGRHIYMPLH
jgi:hypothetical protein